LPSDANENQVAKPVLLEVERFEQVSAGAERVLLRLDGRCADRPDRRVLEAKLFVDDGLAIHRHSPLGDPDLEDVEAGWLWRASYEVPASYLTDARTRFALESEPGRLLDLPRPAQMLLPAAPAVPISARTAQLARRYAAAIAITLAAALTPGVLPAQAGEELLRVTRPDGTVVYVTADGQPVDAAPPTAPAGQPASTPAPDPAPAATPPTDSNPQVPAAGDAQQQEQQPNKDSQSGDPAPAKAAPAAKHANHRKKSAKTPRRTSRPTATSLTGSAQTAATAPAQGSTPRPHHPAPHPAPTDTNPPPPPSDAAPLQSRENLAVDGAQPLQPLTDVAPADATPADAVPPAPSMTGVPELTPPRTSTDTHPPGAPHRPPHHHTPPQPPQTQGRITDRVEPRRTHARRPGGNNSSSPSPVSGGTPTPTPAGPGTQGNFFNSLPGPGNVQGVPNFVIQRFHVPPFLLSIYQAAGIQYGIRWEVLAAINEIETDYGRNLNVSSAGALGWMQFMPATWRMYGVDANKDGKRDPFNPVDAIFAAARYLKAAGGDKDIRTAIFAYNHAGWYVDSVMLRARLVAGYPTDLIGSLTGLTEGRFPVAARARYAGDQNSQSKQVATGQNAANVVDSNPNARGIDIYADKGAPVVAVNDGVIKAMGHSKKLGNYVVLQDVYGNRYTYSGLGSLAKVYPVPKAEAKAAAASKSIFQVVGANDPKPSAPASAGVQRPGAAAPAPKKKKAGKRASAKAKSPITVFKQRLFAHPQRAQAKRHGGLDQILATGLRNKGFETYDNYFSRGLGLNSKNAVLRRLKVGSHVIGSTVLGRVGDGKSPHLHFEIQPAGKGAPKIDPKPFLDGWKLLESSAIYRAKGRNVLYGDGNYSIGEIMLLPKPLLERRVLSDPRIKIYPGGRNDIKTGQIDRRVLVVLAYLAESGLEPTVSCLKSGHSEMTSSGNVSEHWSGNAVDISAINGVPINGHQGPGDVAEQTVKRLMMLQGTLAPHQIISLLDFGRNTMAMGDHADHVHVGFQPLFGQNAKLGRETQSVLKPGQWDTLVQRLGEIQNPVVPTQPSRYAIPDPKSHGK
jgi:hypothetical protein